MLPLVVFDRSADAELAMNSLSKHRQASASRMMCVLAIFAGAVITALGSYRASAAHVTASSLLAAEAKLDSAPLPALTVPDRVAADFSESLGASGSPSRFLASLEREAASAAVTVVGVSVQEHRPTPQTLGRQEFTLSLRGPYVAVKAVLQGLSNQYAPLNVRTLRMRRDAATGNLETSAVLALWSAPLPAAVQPSAPTPR